MRKVSKVQLGGHRVGFWQIVGQCFSVGPLIDVVLLLAAAGMLASSLVVAFFASETGGAGAIGDYIGRAWGRTAGVGVLGIYFFSLLFSGAAGFTIVVGELVARFAEHYFAWSVPWWCGAVGVGVLAWWLNVRGAAAATQAQLIIIRGFHALLVGICWVQNGLLAMRGERNILKRVDSPASRQVSPQRAA